MLFLAGPTGVGKTELAKGIARMIFERDAEPIRFDMSEFGQERNGSSAPHRGSPASTLEAS